MTGGRIHLNRRNLRDALCFLLDSTVDLPADSYDRDTLLMRLECEVNTREAALVKERDALREYLHDICDAYEAWQKACDSPPGGDISDPEYRGPSKDECEAHDVEVTALWNAVGDAIQTACDARQEP